MLATIIINKTPHSDNDDKNINSQINQNNIKNYLGGLQLLSRNKNIGALKMKGNRFFHSSPSVNTILQSKK